MATGGPRTRFVAIGVAVTLVAATLSIAFSRGLSLPGQWGSAVEKRIEKAAGASEAGVGNFGVGFAAIRLFAKFAVTVTGGRAATPTACI